MDREDGGLVVSVVVNWRRPADTIACIESLKVTSYPNHEIIVVDNASNDGSVERIRVAAPGITVLTNSRNLGFAGGVNVGIKQALAVGASHVFLLNNDAVVAADFLEPLVASFRGDPSIGIAAPTVYRFDTDQPFSVGGWPRRFLPLMVHDYRASASKRHAEPVDLPYVWAQAMLIRREVIDAVGLFDPEFFMYYEDCDFCLRTAKKGFRIVHVPQSLVWHKVAQSTSGADWSRWRHKVSSMFHFHRKHGRWGVPQALIQTILTTTVIGAREMIRGNWRWIAYPLARLVTLPRGLRLP